MRRSGILVLVVWRLFDARVKLIKEVESVNRISSAMSDAEVAWVLLVMLALMAMNRMFVAEIGLVVRGLYSRSERIYSDMSWQSNLLAWVYRIGILALVIFLAVGRDYTHFALDYLIVVGVVAVGLLVRYFMAKFVGIVFLSPRQLEGVFEYRASIYNSICVFLWPLALLMRLGNNDVVMMVSCGVIVSMLLLVLIWKGLQLYAKSLLTILYVLLYIISLEIFPILGICFVIKQIL